MDLFFRRSGLQQDPNYAFPTEIRIRLFVFLQNQDRNFRTLLWLFSHEMLSLGPNGAQVWQEPFWYLHNQTYLMFF